MHRSDEHDELLLTRMLELQAQGVVRDDLEASEIGRFLGLMVDGVALSLGAGAPVDVEPVIRLVNDAIAPRK